MKKFWALISTKRIHVYALGKHDDDVKALEAAEAYCERKNAEALEAARKDNPTAEHVEVTESMVLAILDVQDMRDLPGEFIRPYEIPAEKTTVAVEAPKLLGEGERTEVETVVTHA